MGQPAHELAPDSRLAPLEWSSFTRVPLKRRLYSRETYFREALSQARMALAESELRAALRFGALLLVKPDGLVAGKASAVLKYLRANNYSVLAVERPVFTRFHWRELWRYQLNCATLDRLAVNDVVLRDESLLLFLRCDANLDVPASVQLSLQKGPSDVFAQQPDCLRRVLGQPNRVLSFIHVADEPADIIRDLGVLLEPPTQYRVLSAFRSGCMPPQDAELLRKTIIESDACARDLHAQGALERVEAQVLSAKDATHSEALQRVKVELARMRRGERISWRAFTTSIAESDISLDRWDLASLGAQFVVYDKPGVAKLVQGVDSKLWYDRSPD